MKALFISANTERITMPVLPLGPAMVAAAARRAGHEVALLDLLTTHDVRGAVRDAVTSLRPEVIGVSVRNIDDQCRREPRFLLAEVRPVVAACREVSLAPIVLGGAGFSIFPLAVLRYLDADFGVCGEGEHAFVELLDHLACGADPAAIPGVVARWGERGTPPVRIALLDDEVGTDPAWLAGCDLADPEVWVPLQSRRGCALGCSYCSTPRIEGTRPRTRAVERVVAEVRQAAERGARRVQVVDNTFNLPRSYALALCRELARLEPRLQLRGIVYPLGVDQEMAEAMAEAGFVEVSVGFESGAERVLAAMNKRFTLADVTEATENLHEAGIRTLGFLLFGGPGETRGTALRSLDFAASLPLDWLKATAGIRIYPGTPLAAAAAAEGVVRPDDDLLLPRFYLAAGLEGWLDEELAGRGLT